MHSQFLTAILLFSSLSASATASVPNEQKTQKQIKVFYGEQIDPYSEALSELILTEFEKYPYLYERTEGYVNFLKAYGKENNTIVAMAFDGDRLIGVATGIPMQSAGNYRNPFLEKGYDISSMFYMGELVVDPEYRKMGFGQMLYNSLEAAVKQTGKYETIALCQMEDSRYDAYKPTDYLPTEVFWRKLGFQHHPDINIIWNWINVGKSEMTPHLIVYWIKAITTPCLKVT